MFADYIFATIYIIADFPEKNDCYLRKKRVKIARSGEKNGPGCDILINWSFAGRLFLFGGYQT